MTPRHNISIPSCFAGGFGVGCRHNQTPRPAAAPISSGAPLPVVLRAEG